MADWKIRRAKLEDAPALAECIEDAYSAYTTRIADLPLVSEGLAEDIKNNHVSVAVKDHRIVGGLVLVEKKDHLVLANVAVAPKATGMGLGRAFLEHAETEAQRLGLGELQLSTHVDIPENIRLYEHLGWQETARRGNKVQMSKSIRP